MVENFDFDFGEMLDVDMETGNIIPAVEPKPISADEQKKGPSPLTPVESKKEDMLEIPDNPTEEKEETTDGSVEKTEDGKAKETTPPDETPSSSLPYKVLINALHEEGIVSDVDIESIDKLITDEGYSAGEVVLSIIQNEINNQVGLYKNSLPQTIKNLIDKYEEDVPLDELIKVKSEQTRFDKLKEEDVRKDEEVAKRVITALMKEKGESEKRIEKTLHRLEELGELEDDGVESLNELKEIYAKKEKALEDEARARDEANKKRYQEYLDNLQKLVQSTDAIIEGVKLSTNEKDSLYKSMTTPVGYGEDGRPISAVNATMMKNPSAFEMALHYYHQIGLFNIDKDGNFKPDFSKFNKIAKTTAVNELDKVIGSQGNTRLDLKPSQTEKSHDSKKTDSLIKGINKYLNS